MKKIIEDWDELTKFEKTKRILAIVLLVAVLVAAIVLFWEIGFVGMCIVLYVLYCCFDALFGSGRSWPK